MGVLSSCALFPFGKAITLVPTARGYARPTFRNCAQDDSRGSSAAFYEQQLIQSSGEKALDFEQFVRLTGLRRFHHILTAMPDNRPRPIITLTTDFGEEDWYVAAMKGVILGINPEATLIDITHAIAPGNIAGGGFVLDQAVRTYPLGSIHVAVVDPGVGSARRALLAECDGQIFVGPDNGLLTRVIERASAVHLFELDSQSHGIVPESRTFHGRDLFAPIAAHRSRVDSSLPFGKPIAKETLVSLPTTHQASPEQTEVVGQIIHIDHFGNAISNLAASVVNGATQIRVTMNHLPSLPWCQTYSDQPAGTAMALVGSSDLIEVAVNQGNAAAQFRIRVGDRLTLCLENDVDPV